MTNIDDTEMSNKNKHTKLEKKAFFFVQNFNANDNKCMWVDRIANELI